jgi:hypothetical protein
MKASRFDRSIITAFVAFGFYVNGSGAAVESGSVALGSHKVRAVVDSSTSGLRHTHPNFKFLWENVRPARAERTIRGWYVPLAPPPRAFWHENVIITNSVPPDLSLGSTID